MDETKKAKAAAEEAKAIAQGELDTASKTLSDSETHLKDLQQECMAKAEEYETSRMAVHLPRGGQAGQSLAGWFPTVSASIFAIKLNSQIIFSAFLEICKITRNTISALRRRRQLCT